MNRWIPASFAQRVSPLLIPIGTFRVAYAALAHLASWTLGPRLLWRKASATVPPMRLANP